MILEEIKRCSRCVLPKSLPSVELDQEGVCGHCRTYERKSREWFKTREVRQRQLEALVERVQRLNRPYDCLIPLSGGKDSTYALHYFSKAYGLKCLCVTFDNGFLSEHARTNIKNALAVTGSDHVYYRVNRETMLSLYRLFIIKCGDFCQACMRGIEASIDSALRAFNIPMVVAGTGTRISYLPPEVFEAGDVNFFRNVVRGEKLEGEVHPLLNPKPRQESAKLLYKYRLIRGLLFKLLRVPIYGPVPLVVAYIPLYDWIDLSNEQLNNALHAMSWQAPPHEFEHMDCRVHALQAYIHTIKFPELTLNTFFRSGQIRQGLLAREEALRAESEDLSKHKEPDALEPFLKEIRMSQQEFESSVRDWRRMAEFRR